jgi:RimJ/RimL family protein N-acetyltransferase
MIDPPYRVATERTVIRCWEPADAPRLKEAVDASLDHLRPWLTWAFSEPQALAEKVELLRRFRGHFDLGQNFVYGIFDRKEKRVLGGTGLHPVRGVDAFEIGYWIRQSEAGKGLATETAAALTRVAFELCDVDRVHIRVDPENEPSLAIPRKLRFVEEATLRRRLPPHPDGVPRDVVVFTLFRDAYRGSPASTAVLKAQDAVGVGVL